MLQLNLQMLRDFKLESSSILRMDIILTAFHPRKDIRSDPER